MTTDLSLSFRQPSQVSSDRQSVDLRLGPPATTTVSGRENLIQAILNRLYTRQGELTSLGHPTYGSRLYELVGNLNSDRVRRLAELYIRDCLAQEARIAEIVQVTFEPPARSLSQQTTLTAAIVIRSIEEPTLIAIDLTVSL